MCESGNHLSFSFTITQCRWNQILGSLVVKNIQYSICQKSIALTCQNVSIIWSQILIFKNTLNEEGFQKQILHNLLKALSLAEIILQYIYTQFHKALVHYGWCFLIWFGVFFWGGVGVFCLVFGFFVWFCIFFVLLKISIYISAFCAAAYSMFYLSVKGTASLKVAIKWHHSKGQHYGPDLLVCGFAVVGLVWVCLFFKTHLDLCSMYKCLIYLTEDLVLDDIQTLFFFPVSLCYT